MQGFFAGDRVQRAGLVYTLGGGSTFGANTIYGSLAFGSTGLDVAALPPAPTPESTGSISAPFNTSSSGGGIAITFGSDNAASLTRASGGIGLGFDANGQVTSINNNGNNYDRGTAVTAELYGNASFQIGRWNGGTATGPGGNSVLKAGFDGFHYAVFRPFVATPTLGSATYALAGATKPTYGNGTGETGTFTGTLGVAFDSAIRVGYDLIITMPDRTYTVSTTGGSATPATGQALTTAGQFGTNSITLTSGGTACPGLNNCLFTARGGLVEGGRDFAFTYQIGPSSTSTGDANVVGAAVFSSPTAPGTRVIYDTRSTGAPSATLTAGNYTLIAPTRSPVVSTATAMTFGASGELRTFSTNNNVGSSNASEVGTKVFASTAGSATAFMGWGRWTGGRSAAISSSDDYTSGNTGFAYVYGTPSTDTLPTTGTATYTLAGASAPTIASGARAPGSVTSGAMAIAFGTTSRVGFELGLTMPGDAQYTMSTTGGSANPATSGLTFTSASRTFAGAAALVAVPVGTTSAACGAGPCNSATVSGSLFGPNAGGVGIGYSFGSGVNQISGVATFNKN